MKRIFLGFLSLCLLMIFAASTFGSPPTRTNDAIQRHTAQAISPAAIPQLAAFVNTEPHMATTESAAQVAQADEAQVLSAPERRVQIGAKSPPNIHTETNDKTFPFNSTGRAAAWQRSDPLRE